MTREEIVRMAREADIKFKTDVFCSDFCDGVYEDDLERFAALIRADERDRLTNFAIQAAEKSVDVAIALEREACAKVCDETYYSVQAAEIIRVRGKA